MAWTNDSKPNGSYVDDSTPIPFSLYGVAKYGFSKYGTLYFTNDSKPSGSYINDTKPS